MVTTLLAISAVLLFFFVIFYIAKTSELSSVVKGDVDDYAYASKVNAFLLLAFLILGLIGMGYSIWKLVPRMLPESASIHGSAIDSMFNVTSIITLIVVVLTHIALVGFAFTYRYKKGREKYFNPHNNTLEAVWTIIPAIVLTFLVVRGIVVWDDIFDFAQVENTETHELKDDVLGVEVTAKQFGWIIRYPGTDGELGERIIDSEHVTGLNELGVDWEDENSHDDIYANELVLVKGKPTMVYLGAQDVLHGFYLPHFRVKMDCVPGLPTKFMFTPMYTTEEYVERLKNSKYWNQIEENGKAKYENFKFELACTELCGRSHFGMQKDVRVVTQEEYDAWVVEQSAKSYYKTVINPVAANTDAVEDVVVDEETIIDELQDAGAEDQLHQTEPSELEEHSDDNNDTIPN